MARKIEAFALDAFPSYLGGLMKLTFHNQLLRGRVEEKALLDDLAS